MSLNFPYSGPLVTIANGTSLSPSFYIGAGVPVSILMPGTWTAAGLWFEGSVDNVNFFTMVDADGNPLLISAPAASQLIPIAENLTAVGASGTTTGSNVVSEQFLGVMYLKIGSGTSAAPVNQGQASTLQVTIRKSLTGGLY